MITFEQFMKEINNLPTTNVVKMFNAFSEKHSLQDEFYQMEDLDILLEDKTPMEVLNSLAEGFDKDKSYIQMDGYGNYASFSGKDVEDYIRENGYLTEIWEDESLWEDEIDTSLYEDEEEY